MHVCLLYFISSLKTKTKCFFSEFSVFRKCVWHSVPTDSSGVFAFWISFVYTSKRYVFKKLSSFYETIDRTVCLIERSIPTYVWFIFVRHILERIISYNEWKKKRKFYSYMLTKLRFRVCLSSLNCLVDTQTVYARKGRWVTWDISYKWFNDPFRQKKSSYTKILVYLKFYFLLSYLYEMNLLN